MASGLSLYAAGMVLNDLYDLELDRVERPERPLPQGRISPQAASAVGHGLLGAGVVCGMLTASSAGWAGPAGVACLLGMAVWLYDRHAKKTVWGPLVMGSCRSLNWLLGMAAAGGPSAAHEWLIPIGMGMYAGGVTLYARDEAGRSRVANLAVATLVMLAGLAVAGLAFLLELGAEFCDDHGDRLAPVALILQTYTRNPEGKHACLEIAAAHVELPDTAPMAVHRGRIDLLEAHLRRDPELLTRTFSHQEIFPPELGCHADETFALHGTPLGGATLLHIAVDHDEFEVVEWILANGGPVDARAATDKDGFGGHTALFGCIVWQPHHSKARPSSERYVRMFLDHGANVNARASLRKALRFVEDESLHEYINVTPRSWGERFHDQAWVDKKALALVCAEGGEL
jgi:hypothetical protein